MSGPHSALGGKHIESFNHLLPLPAVVSDAPAAEAREVKKPKPKRKRERRETTARRCHDCSMTIHVHSWRPHVRTIRHKRATGTLQGDEKATRHCELCDKTVGMQGWNVHVKSGQHRAAFEGVEAEGSSEAS